MRVFSSPPLVFLLLALLCLLSFTAAGVGKNAMLLQDVSSLVFTKGDMTTSRRSSPVPQLSCKSGPCQYSPASALCRNAGFDGTDVTWKCEAELPKGVKFGKVDVSCEGFANRDDEYVLKGSCGLEYGLVGEPTFESEEREEDTWYNRNVRHNAGEKMHDSKVHDSTTYDRASAASSASSWLSWLTDSSSRHGAYGQAKDYAQRQYDTLHPSATQRSSSFGLFSLFSSLLSSLFSLGIKAIAAVIILYLVYKLIRPSTSTAVPAQRAAPSLFRSLLGGLPFSSLLGGSQPQGAYPPPPPYPGHSSQGYNPSPYDKSYATPPPTQQQQGSGFGVLPGLLGGSLLGYLMGRRRTAPAPVQTEVGGGSWFGGGARPAQAARPVYRNAAPMSAEERRAAARSYESTSTTEVPDVRTTETSTAYATTKRR